MKLKKLFTIMIIALFSIAFMACQLTSDEDTEQVSAEGGIDYSDITPPIVEDYSLHSIGHRGRLKIYCNETIQPKVEGWRIIKINSDGTISNLPIIMYTSENSYINENEYVIKPDHSTNNETFIDGEFIVIGIVLDKAGNITPVEPIHIIGTAENAEEENKYAIVN